MDNQCGNSIWEAAANDVKKKGSFNETGLIFSSCRHQVAQRGVNMFQGGLFAYHHFIHAEDIVNRDVSFIF